jgi:DNA-binding transcriptional MerR regulator
VRMSELSERSGVPVATIKYYVREGLLPAGEATAWNQARYDDRHVERLALIRALREGAGLSIATLGRVLAVMEDHQPAQRPQYLTIAIRELTEPLHEEEAAAPEFRQAEQDVDELLGSLGWDTDRDSPGVVDLVRAVAAIHRFLPGTISGPNDVEPYATAVRRLADHEIARTFDPDSDPSSALRFSVLGTVLFEPVLLALRKLAHVDRNRELARDGRS